MIIKSGHVHFGVHIFPTGINSSRGCISLSGGGFGIRNFLALFLSMEVSKAISDKEVCTKARIGR